MPRTAPACLAVINRLFQLKALRTEAHRHNTKPTKIRKYFEEPSWRLKRIAEYRGAAAGMNNLALNLMLRKVVAAQIFRCKIAEDELSSSRCRR